MGAGQRSPARHHPSYLSQYFARTSPAVWSAEAWMLTARCLQNVHGGRCNTTLYALDLQASGVSVSSLQFSTPSPKRVKKAGKAAAFRTSNRSFRAYCHGKASLGLWPHRTPKPSLQTSPSATSTAKTAAKGHWRSPWRLEARTSITRSCSQASSG